MYFKSEVHKDLAEKLMKKFGYDQLTDDREYGTFSYVAAATFKQQDLQEAVSPAGIDLDTLEQKMLIYSPSEMALIRFGLQLYGGTDLDDITIPEVMLSLDDDNRKVVMEAIRFRFKL